MNVHLTYLNFEGWHFVEFSASEAAEAGQSWEEEAEDSPWCVALILPQGLLKHSVGLGAQLGLLLYGLV